MSKIKSNLGAIHKTLRIFLYIRIREIKKSNSMIFKSKSARMLETIDRGWDKLATAKQSQIIFDLQAILLDKRIHTSLQKYPQSMNNSCGALERLVGNY